MNVCVNSPAHTKKMLSGAQYTERFGLRRLWHPQCDYLFAVILENGALGWASIFTKLSQSQVRAHRAAQAHPLGRNDACRRSEGRG
jgi:hypothetical protein